MKKSLVALAVLAASGAAMAQSSVTLYGVADLWFGSVNNDNGTTSLTQTLLESGGVNTSRWGLKGSEDLGGGLKANFNLQQGIKLDDGSASVATLAFNRQSWVGFSGGFGAVRLGRTTTAFDDVSGTSDAVLDSKLAPMGYVFKSTGYSARQNNMFYYQAPDFGGFSGAISYALGEDKTATTSATSTTSLNLTYAAGPVSAQLGYQVQDVINAVGEGDENFFRLGGTYAFGPAVAKLTYGKAGNIKNVDGADATEWQLGVDYVLSPALVLTGSLAQSSDNAKAGDFTRKGFGLAAKYIMSKRTFLYGGYEADTTTKTNVADQKHSVLAVGVQHNF
jgi:predicted porin